MKVNPVNLLDLLSQVESGLLRLPDFQRSWVWDDERIRRLLASISLSYPIGAIMTVDTGNPEMQFLSRLIEGVSDSAPSPPGALLLDGQQRLTALYLALRSPQPVKIQGARGRTIKRHYYADIKECIDPEVDRQEVGIFSVPEDRIVRKDFDRRIELNLSTREKEAVAGKFPLDIILDSDLVEDWMWMYLEVPSAAADRKERWKAFKKGVITPFTRYQIPVLALSKDTSKLAVCQVFENVNTGGVVLTVFELLTATYAADGFVLREDWERRESGFGDHPLLKGLPNTAFLQVVSLLATYDRRRRHRDEHPEDDRPPAVSAKRIDLLRLTLDDYQKWADVAADGLKRADEFVRGEYVFARRDLPYPSQLVPLAAILGLIGSAAVDVGANRERLRQWYWCGVFGELYGGSTETRWANDLLDCVAWVRGGGTSPRTVQDAQFQAERLLTLRTRQSAAYKGFYALTMRQGARDLGNGAGMDMTTFLHQQIDIHHIFPRHWCEQKDPTGEGSRGLTRPIPWEHSDCIVNKTAISAVTNGYIGGRAPSQYVPGLQKRGSTSDQRMNELLRGHRIDPIALRQDDFRRFFNHRFEDLLVLVESAMGKRVNRLEARDESPYFETDLVVRIERDIRRGESEWLEFKSTAYRNLHTSDKDVRMRDSVVKTIAAFLNTDGGTLLVGVGDAGNAIGIEQDYPLVKGGDRDGWERWLTDTLISALGKPATALLKVRFAEVNERTLARVEVDRSPEPVYARYGAKESVLFVRVNNATHQMEGADLQAYIAEHWPVLLAVRA